MVIEAMEKFFDSVMRALNHAKEQFGSGAALSEASGVSTVNISRWTNRTRSPKVEEISPIMDIVGARVVLPCDTYTPEERNLSKRLVVLERQLAEMTKERDILKGQVEILKEVMRPASDSSREEPEKKLA